MRTNSKNKKFYKLTKAAPGSIKISLLSAFLIVQSIIFQYRQQLYCRAKNPAEIGDPSDQ